MYNTIVIAMTNKCNAKCDMCCFSCNPDNNLVLGKASIFSVIDQAKEISTFNKVAFSGGEPFLFLELLEDSIKYAKTKGFTISCISNGFWGNDKEEVEKILLKLKQAGLSELRLSYDQFHEEYIPFENIKNIIVVSKVIGLACYLGIGVTKSSKKASYYIDELGCDGFHTSIQYYPYLPVGEALKNTSAEDYYSVCNKRGLYCTYGNMLLVLYDGNVYPCCSNVIKDTFFKAGNIYEKKLTEIIKSIKTNLVLFILMKKGFNWFIDVIETELQISLPKNFISQCHLCHTIFSDKELISKLIPYMKKEVENYIETSKTQPSS